MKIIGKTPEGDLIIQVSQAEWNGLQDGVRPKKGEWETWRQSEIYKLVPRHGYGSNHLGWAFRHGGIDGSIQSLQDVTDGKIRVVGIGPVTQVKLKKLLDDHRAQSGDEGE